MTISIKPTYFKDLFKAQSLCRQQLEKCQNLHQKLLIKRNFLCFALIYNQGYRPKEMLSLDFSQLITHHHCPEWKNWLEDYQKQLKLPTPWFHTARYNGLRIGLSRRGFEDILKAQSQNFKLTPWSTKSLRQAHIIKLLLKGKSHQQIRINLRLNPRFDLKPYEQYIEKISPHHTLFSEITPL